MAVAIAKQTAVCKRFLHQIFSPRASWSIKAKRVEVGAKPIMVEDQVLRAWFCREVLPLEPRLMAYIARNWRAQDELADLRQEIYERVLTGASRGLPLLAAPYLFTTARNHLISRARRAQIISFELVADPEAVVSEADVLTPERHASGREELQRVQQGLEQLPRRCREILWLRKVQHMSSRAVAEKLGISVDVVDHQTSFGLRALVDFMLGGSGRIARGTRRPAKLRQVNE